MIPTPTAMPSSKVPRVAALGSLATIIASSTYATRYPTPVTMDSGERSRRTRNAKMLNNIRTGVANRSNSSAAARSARSATAAAMFNVAPIAFWRSAVGAVPTSQYPTALAMAIAPATDHAKAGSRSTIAGTRAPAATHRPIAAATPARSAGRPCSAAAR